MNMIKKYPENLEIVIQTIAADIGTDILGGNYPVRCPPCEQQYTRASRSCRWRMFQTRWPGPALAEGVAAQLAGDLPAAGAALSDVAFHSVNGCRRSSNSAVLSRSLPTMPPSKCRFRL